MDTGRLIGEKIDQYRIERHIARGGMADVYLAQDEDLGRYVAFKVMLDVLALDANYVRRFQREARTVARLNHPGIVQVYSTGKTPLGQPYIAMQYIEGGSLRERLEELADRNKLLTTEQVLNIMRQLAVALGVAHRGGIVHRDLKPSNVLIRPDGSPVLVDLGIAAVRSDVKLTNTGGLMGTPGYMSPELFASKELDGRSDLYSLGIMFYEMFAGVQPFYADELPAIVFKQLHEEAIPLSEVRPDLSPQIVRIVDTLLQKDPNNRFQSAEDLVGAIDYVLKSQTGFGYNPQATEVLTRLDDSVLLSRQGVLQRFQAATPRTPYGYQQKPSRGVPIWVVASLGVLILALVGYIFISSANGGGEETPTALPTRIVVEDGATPEELVQVPTTPAPVTSTAAPPASPAATLAVATPTALPTATATATPPPTDTPTATPPPSQTPVCEGAFPTRLRMGSRAQVVNYQLNVRTGPGTNFPIENRLSPGREVTVIDGPVCDDGQLWYHIDADIFFTSAGQEVHTVGWAVEESGGEYFLAPIN